MARVRTIRIGSINLRIHSRHSPDEYVSLWKTIVRSKAIKKRGANAIMFGGQRQIDPSNHLSPFFGFIYRFVNIDPRDPWFDIDRNRRAADSDVAAVRLPSNLKPNLTQIPYLFDPRRHRLYFATFSSNGVISPGQVKSLLDELSSYRIILERFGNIDSTVVVREGALEEMINWPKIKNIHVVLERPNPTEFEDDESYYERLRRRNLCREEHKYVKAPESETITPDDEMLAIFQRATTDGVYTQRGINSFGKLQTVSSSEYPRIDSGNYDPNLQTESDAFIQLALS